MTRPALPEAQYLKPSLTVLSQKLESEITFTVIGQGRTFTPNRTTPTTQNSRIGDSKQAVTQGASQIQVTVVAYFENNLKTVARLCGTPSSGTWLGTEAIKPDTTVKQDFKLETYATDETGSALLFTEYIYGFLPNDDTAPVDSSSSQARTMTLTGFADEMYMTPVAGTVS